MAGVGRGEPALGMQRLDAHGAHQRGHMLAADGVAAASELAPDASDPVEGQLHVDLVDGGHQGQVGRARGYRFVVDAGAGEAQEPCLPGDRQGRGLVDHRFALAPFK